MSGEKWRRPATGSLLTVCFSSYLVGCGGNPQIDLQSGPSKPFEQAAPAEAKPSAFSLLGIEPGRTTLEEFRSRFNASEPKETAAKGVQTADTGAEADLSAKRLKFTRLKVVALNGGVFDRLREVRTSLPIADEASERCWQISASGSTPVSTGDGLNRSSSRRKRGLGGGVGEPRFPAGLPARRSGGALG